MELFVFLTWQQFLVQFLETQICSARTFDPWAAVRTFRVLFSFQHVNQSSARVQHQHIGEISTCLSRKTSMRGVLKRFIHHLSDKISLWSKTSWQLRFYHFQKEPPKNKLAGFNLIVRVDILKVIVLVGIKSHVDRNQQNLFKTVATCLTRIKIKYNILATFTFKRLVSGKKKKVTFFYSSVWRLCATLVYEK